MSRYAARAFGRKFEDGRQVPLAVFAASALDAAGVRAREHWLSRLAGVRTADVDEVLAEIPRMSEPARSFCRQLLEMNREGVLNVCR